MSDKVWDYRVVRSNNKDESDEWYTIQEIYYDDGKPMAQSIDLMVEGGDIQELSTQLQKMMWALEQPIVDELHPVNEVDIIEIKEEEIG